VRGMAHATDLQKFKITDHGLQFVGRKKNNASRKR